MIECALTEADSEAVIAGYRRIGRPALFFLPLHGLEVRNAILQRAFHQRRALASGERQRIACERDAAVRRLEHLIGKRTLVDVTIDMDPTIARASQLSAAHTEKLGLRAIDLLHVGSAPMLESELFLRTDERQALLAKAEGLKVASVG